MSSLVFAFGNLLFFARRIPANKQYIQTRILVYYSPMVAPMIVSNHYHHVFRDKQLQSIGGLLSQKISLGNILILLNFINRSFSRMPLYESLI